MALFWVANGSSGELLENNVLSGATPAAAGHALAKIDDVPGDMMGSLSGFSEVVLIGRILYRLILLAAASLYLFDHMAGGCRVAAF